LVGLGLSEDQAARARAIRERLVLRPRRTRATEEPAVLEAVSR